MLVVLILATVASSQSWAQQKGQIRAGGSLALGTSSAISDTGAEKLGIGINLGGDYFITDVISIAPSYTFFFKSSYQLLGVDLSLKSSSFNIDGKYYFLTEVVNVYGLAGLSIATVNTETTIDLTSFGGGIETVSAKASEAGLNIGGGVDYGLSDKLYLNGQLKYNTPLSQLVINFGVGYNIN